MTQKNQTRFLLDKYLWDVFVAACGGKCVAPGCTETEGLQRGHIRSHAAGGLSVLENLQPLCATHNGRYTKTHSMDDDRPPDWRSNFVKQVASELRLRMAVLPFDKKQGPSYTLNPQNSLEKKQVITWERVIFEHDSELTTPLANVSTPLPSSEVSASVHELIRRGTKHIAPIPPPSEKCKDKLKHLVDRHGRVAFLRAGQELLDQKQWFENDGRRVPGWSDPWTTFAANFDIYLADADERVAMLTKQATADRERVKQDRWQTYLDAAKVNWLEMVGADKEFAAKVQGSTGEPQVISEVDYQQAKDILDRYRTFANKRRQLLDLVGRTLDKMTVDGNDQEQIELYYKLKELRSKVSATRDLNDPKLAEYYAEVMPLLRRLDPQFSR
jgi:hypothetical protein